MHSALGTNGHKTQFKDAKKEHKAESPGIPRKYSWYSFLSEAESTTGPLCGRKDYVKENYKNTMENRTRDLPACSAVPQATAPQRTNPVVIVKNWN